MTLDRWWLFLATVVVVSGTPGPNMLHVMRRSIEVGFARSGWAMAGCLTTVMAALTASALGLGALLAAMPHLFEALRYAGAAYLVWLGIRAWRDAGAAAPEDAAVRRRTVAAARLYRDAMLTGLGNPKLIVFAGALFPQFIDPHAPRLPQFVVLVATFAAVETAWYAIYAAGGRRLAGWLARGARQRVFDRATGALFVAFGAALVAARA